MRKIKNLYGYIFIAMCFSLVLTMVNSLLKPIQYNDWSITEHLINYSSGFIRRGLQGEVLFFLNQEFGINVWWAIHIFAVIIAILTFCLLTKETIKAKHSIFLIPSALFLGIEFVCDVWHRKDIFIILLLLLYVKLLFSEKKVITKFIFCNSILILGTLCHEILFFLSFPVTIVYFAKKHNISTLLFYIKSLPKGILFILPSLTIFLISCIYKGDVESASCIWQSWTHLVEGAISGAIKGIGWTSQYAMDRTLAVWNVTKLGIVYYPILWILLFAMLTIIYVRMDTLNGKIFKYQCTAQYSNIESLSILLFQIMVLTPIFFVFCDTSRLFFLIVISSFIIRLYSNNRYSQFTANTFIYKGVDKLSTWSERKIKIPKTWLLVIVLILGFPTINTSAIEHVVVHGTIGLFFQSIINFISLIVNQCPAF